MDDLERNRNHEGSRNSGWQAVPGRKVLPGVWRALIEHLGGGGPNRFLSWFEVREDVEEVPGKRPRIVAGHAEGAHVADKARQFVDGRRFDPPDARQVGLAIRRARRPFRKVGRPIAHSWSPRRPIVQPLRLSLTAHRH